MIQFNYNDGGRKEDGRKGHTGDCVARAICIATGLPYEQVYSRLAKGNQQQRITKHTRHRKHAGSKTASHGIYTKRKWFDEYMKELGFVWLPKMKIGQGCTTHLTKDELPTTGRLVVNVSRHMCAVIDGVLNDTYDCSREGTRCVYGFYQLKEDFWPAPVELKIVSQDTIFVSNNVMAEELRKVGAWLSDGIDAEAKELTADDLLEAAKKDHKLYRQLFPVMRISATYRGLVLSNDFQVGLSYDLDLVTMPVGVVHVYRHGDKKSKCKYSTMKVFFDNWTHIKPM